MSEEAVAEARQPATEGETLVELRDLRTYYEADSLLSGQPVKAVDGVTFDIKRGETLGLVGESGCGKTTLGRTLVQLEEATGGEIRYDGRDITEIAGENLTYWRRNTQMVFQDPESSLNDRMTVGSIVREPLDVHGWPDVTATVEGGGGDVPIRGDRVHRVATAAEADVVVRVQDGEPTGVTVREGFPMSASDVSARRTDDGGVAVTIRKNDGQLRRQRVRDLLDTVGLREEHYYRYPHQFSGGQRQRIGVARALALEPEFVVLDEPVSALDVSVQAQILNLLEDLQDEFGLTYLFIAHDLSVVRHICDRVAVMYLGNIMEIGPTEELFADPANPYTNALLSAIPEPDPEADLQRITLRGTPPSPRDPPVGCPFSTRCPVKIRPEEYADVSDDLWERVEVFREVVRERTRADRSLSDRARELLGRQTRFSDMSEVYGELFGTIDAPSDVERHVRQAADMVEANNAEEAREYLFEQFGSVCDTTPPEHYEVSASGRTSRCHLHDEGYEDPRAKFERLER